MENRENNFQDPEPELLLVQDETEVVTEAGEDEGDKDHCPQQGPCTVR